MFGDDLHYYGFQKDHGQFLDEVKESFAIDRVLAKLMEEKTRKVKAT